MNEKPYKLQALAVLILLFLASLQRYSTAKENVEEGKFNEHECGKLPLPGRIKVAFMYLLSVKNTEGAPNQDLQNLECSAYGLCRTDFHQNLQYCT